MAGPRPSEIRLFRRCATQQQEEARILLIAGHIIGFVYLSGYGVECILKALVLSAVTATDRARMLQSFRGARAHAYEWLRLQYFHNRGPSFPLEIREAFVLVGGWSTEMRYLPGSWDPGDAEDFLDAADSIIKWAVGKF